MDGIEIYKYGRLPVRTICEDDEVWSALVDVCKVLELTNPRMVADRLDDDELRKLNLRSQSGETWFISEAGLYHVILTSRSEKAKPFRRWVTHKVLPDIRKKGYYSSIPAEQLIKQLKAEMKKDKDLTPITVYEKLTGKKLVDKKQLLKDQEAERKKWQKERAEEIRQWHAFTMRFDELYAEVEEHAQKAGVSKEAFRAIAAGLDPKACQEVDGVLMFNQFAIRCAIKELFRIQDERRAG